MPRCNFPILGQQDIFRLLILQPTFELVEAEIVYKNANKPGQITAGWLRLRGLVAPVRIAVKRDTASPLYRVVSESMPDSKGSWVVLDINGDEEATNDAKGRVLYCLSLLSNGKYVWGLVLKCVHASTIPATYERVGIFELLLHVEFWQGVLDSEMTLV